MEEIRKKRNGMHPNQYGFVKGKSTTHAMKKISDIVKRKATWHNALILVDVKNAFNCASWEIIIKELRRWG